MELNLTAVFEVNDAASLTKIDDLGSLEELEAKIFECVSETCVGTLGGGIDYKLNFLRPTPLELKRALVDSKAFEPEHYQSCNAAE